VGLWGSFCGFVWVLLVNPFSLFHFSIKLLITYQKKKILKRLCLFYMLGYHDSDDFVKNALATSA
jgi:hypothetical protein